MIDVAPTILEAAGLPQPVFVNGVQQHPIEGVSMAVLIQRCQGGRAARDAVLRDVRQPRHLPQGLDGGDQAPDALGDRRGQTAAFDDDVWELYDTTTDWSQSKDLAKENPEKLHELQRLWLIEAVKYNVLPLDDRFAERANPDIAGRPQLIKGNRQLLFGGMGRLTESSIVNYKNKSHAVTAEVVVPPSGAEGVIIALGGITGGWSLYAKDGKPKYHYNFYGLNRYTVEGTSKIPAGTHQVRMEFEYDGGGMAKGGAVTLYVDGKKVGEGRVDQTEPMVFSADETCDVGNDFGSPSSDGLSGPDTKFSGEVNWVEIDLGKDAVNLDHLISPEQRLQVAMAHQ